MNLKPLRPQNAVALFMDNPSVRYGSARIINLALKTYLNTVSLLAPAQPKLLHQALMNHFKKMTC